MAIAASVGFVAQPVVTSDVADLPGGPCAGLWVAGAGTVTVTPVGQNVGVSVPLGSVAAATLIPIACKRVWATGTGATNILALYP